MTLARLAPFLDRAPLAAIRSPQVWQDDGFVILMSGGGSGGEQRRVAVIGLLLHQDIRESVVRVGPPALVSGCSLQGRGNSVSAAAIEQGAPQERSTRLRGILALKHNRVQWRKSTVRNGQPQSPS